MKGSVLVVVYSVILIIIFGVFCYLMTTVNPDPLPEEVRRSLPDDNTYPTDLPPNDNVYYGLEKIPEGVDADEFRKQLKNTVSYDIDMDQTSHEGTQRVVPPIWPSEQKLQLENTSKFKNVTNPKTLLEISSPVKGLRRSVNDTNYDKNENPETVLLKIIDESGRKKIEIKFVSREKVKTKRLRQNRSSNLKLNNTLDLTTNSNESNNFTDQYMHAKEKVIQIKADDVILFTIINDSDVVLDDSDVAGKENTDDISKLIMNISETGVNFNRTLNKSTTFELQNAQKGRLMSTEIYTIN